MTLPLPGLSVPVPVRCLNPLCRRWLRDPVSISRGWGPDCAEAFGLIPPRRHTVVSGAADQPLFDINEGGSMKYESLAELKAAYESGELSRDVALTLDNDCSFVYVGGEKVYEGGGYELREEALTLLGIPWEPA